MITLEQALTWAIERIEGEPPRTNDGKWAIQEGGFGRSISGIGGWNRYHIRGNEVTFSSFHATKEATNKARAVGFRIE